jgi:threonine dehydrogenase-like Zn-dependent dehydrogenase
MHSKGADLVIEASGHDSSLAAVLDYVRIGGRVTFVGISIGRGHRPGRRLSSAYQCGEKRL